MSGFSISVRSNANAVITELMSASREMPDATVRALNKMADQVKVQGAREVKATGFGIKVSEIKKAMRVQRANKGNLRASVVVSGRPIALINYGARKTAKGVSVNVLKGRKIIAGAFIATMPSGHTGVYVREPGAKHKKVGNGKKSGWHALPIRELYGPSVPGALANDAVQKVLMQFIEEKFPSLLQQEHAWLARKAKG